jgi:catechol 2,3-dioxygenase-like lactoylglutathione lyase family enzyme
LPVKAKADKALSRSADVFCAILKTARKQAVADVTFDHLQLRSPDPEATASWLEQMLGGEIIRNGAGVGVRLGGANVFIAPVTEGDGVAAPPSPPYRGLDHFGLTVKNLDAFAAELKSKGVVFAKEPTTTRPGVKTCFIRGPEGIWIELLQRD